MWPGPRPTCVPSFILIRPTVWPQYTNVTVRTGQAGQTDNGPIALGEPFYKRLPDYRVCFLVQWRDQNIPTWKVLDYAWAIWLAMIKLHTKSEMPVCSRSEDRKDYAAFRKWDGLGQLAPLTVDHCKWYITQCTLHTVKIVAVVNR